MTSPPIDQPAPVFVGDPYRYAHESPGLNVCKLGTF
jgi:hypothetical protein